MISNSESNIINANELKQDNIISNISDNESINIVEQQDSKVPSASDLSMLSFTTEDLQHLEKASKVWFDYGCLRYFDKLKN